MNRSRLISASIMAPIAIYAIVWLPSMWLNLLAAGIMLSGFWEWTRLAGPTEAKNRQTGLRVATCVLALGLLVISWRFNLLHIMNHVAIAIWIAASAWLCQPQWGHRHWLLTLGVGVTASAWSSFLLIESHPHGRAWLLLALLLVWAADSGAYFCGRRFGQRPLAKTISPNKTVEGAIGGMLSGVCVACGFNWLVTSLTMPWLNILITAVVTVSASIVGDLFESLLKRRAGMKDSGRLIPGHGGVLDRIDGVLAALPFFALCQEIFLS